MFNRTGCPGRRGQLAHCFPFSSAVFDAQIIEFRVYWEIVVTKEKSQPIRIVTHGPNLSLYISVKDPSNDRDRKRIYVFTNAVHIEF
jgi:hypothetical protein